jgi:hypothetical protein
MADALKAAIILLIILIAVCLLRGQEPVIFTGKMVLPGPDAKKPYTFKGSVTITPEKIEISCEKRLFRLFNTFSDLRKRKLSIDTKDVDKIEIKGKRLIIYPTMVFYQRYRNIFKPAWKLIVAIFPQAVDKEYQIISFRLDKPQAAAVSGARLFKIINDQARQLREKHGDRGTGKIVEIF